MLANILCQSAQQTGSMTFPRLQPAAVVAQMPHITPTEQHFEILLALRDINSHKQTLH